MDRFETLHVFVAVVDAGGFSAAASRLGVTKSAVSRRVAELEDRLGARLLNRTTRRLSVTEAGALFHERAAGVLAALQEAEAEASDANGAPGGTLRLAAPVSFGVGHVAPTVAAFMTRHPRIDVEMDLNDRFVDLVEEGFDVAVRVGRLADSGLIARKLAPVRRFVCASPAYVERRGAPRTADDLKDHDGLAYANLAPADNWRLRGPDGRVASPRVACRLRANNGEALVAAAAAGLGVVVLPDFLVAEELRAGRLVTLLDDHEAPPVDVFVVYPHARHLSSKVRLFVDFLASRFGPTAAQDDAPAATGGVG